MKWKIVQRGIALIGINKYTSGVSFPLVGNLSRVFKKDSGQAGVTAKAIVSRQ